MATSLKRRIAKRAPAKSKTKRPASSRRWSAKVMLRSDALDLEQRAFTWRDPKRIARSLKNSAERSKRRKVGPFQSAMSMLNFYLNRGGRNLPAARKKVLNQAKTELRRLFGRA
jgi:Protein of unknown function (DUF3175)